MAEIRSRPYSQFNFTVEADGNIEFAAGFQEVSGLGIEITVAEYRAGNSSLKAPSKINTMFKVPDVTLKRGVVGATELYSWMKDVRDGKQGDTFTTLTISLRNEAGEDESVAAWELIDARPIKYTGPSLNGKGTDVAVEELVFACEDIKIKGE
jgi:phage tail-like protein